MAQFIEAISVILSFVRLVLGAFKKTPEENEKSELEKMRAWIDEFRKTGRPPE